MAEELNLTLFKKLKCSGDMLPWYRCQCLSNITPLMEKGADVNFRHPSTGLTLLHQAAENGCFKSLQFLLQNGASVNEKNSQGSTALHTILQKQEPDFEKFKELLRHGADVNIPTSGIAVSPLHIAVSVRDEKFVKALIESGADLDTESLVTAITRGKTEIARLLISYGANVNSIYHHKGTTTTPLFCAVERDDVSFAGYVLENGGKFCAQSALVSAISAKKLEMVKLLVRNGAKVNVKYRSGHTPLTKAIEVQDLEIIKFLVDNDADINMADAQGISPLMQAIRLFNTDIVKFLLDRGAICTLFHDEKQKPLISTICGFHPELFKVLLENRKISLTDDQGNMSLPPFLENNCQDPGFAKLVKTVVEKSKNPNIICKCGYSFLTKFVEKQKYEMVLFLVKKKVDVNMKDNHGNVPLLVAAKKRNFQIFDCLFKAGAKLEGIEKELDEIVEISQSFAFYFQSLE